MKSLQNSERRIRQLERIIPPLAPPPPPPPANDEWKFCLAQLAVVGAHLGGWQRGEWPLEAVARSIGMHQDEMLNVICGNQNLPAAPVLSSEAPTVFRKIETLLTDLIADRARSTAGSDQEPGFDALREAWKELYAEVPQQLKDEWKLRPRFED